MSSLPVILLEKNVDEAMQWLQKAAGQSNLDAKAILSKTYNYLG